MNKEVKFYMNLFESFKMALDSIKSNKMRSFLTMLGIIIGISSVITIVSLGQGAQGLVNDQFLSLGATNVNITLDSKKAQSNDYFTLEDVKTIKNKVSSVIYAGASIRQQGIASNGKTNKIANLTGGDEDYISINNIDLSFGRSFNGREVEEAKPVALISTDSAKLLFGYVDCIGKTIKVGSLSANTTVTIIGVKKPSGGFGGNFNIKSIDITVPITFLQTLYSNKFILSTITVVGSSQVTTTAAGNGARNIIESRHNNKGRDVYNVDNVFKNFAQINSILGIFTTFVGAVAAISLLVGGIGVMNIMLVSVTERTREIGTRKAIGATTSHILVQFLLEAVILSLIGGIIGMAFGIGVAEIVGAIVNVVPILSPMVVIGAILFSTIVGIFFGIYPARKAAKLSPIDALRYE